MENLNWWHVAETALLRMRRVGSEYFHRILPELLHDAADSG
jgi:hypothetical protein